MILGTGFTARTSGLAAFAVRRAAGNKPGAVNRDFGAVAGGCFNGARLVFPCISLPLGLGLPEAVSLTLTPGPPVACPSVDCADDETGTRNTDAANAAANTSSCVLW